MKKLEATSIVKLSVCTLLSELSYQLKRMLFLSLVETKKERVINFIFISVKEIRHMPLGPFENLHTFVFIIIFSDWPAKTGSSKKQSQVCKQPRFKVADVLLDLKKSSRIN